MPYQIGFELAADYEEVHIVNVFMQCGYVGNQSVEIATIICLLTLCMIVAL